MRTHAQICSLRKIIQNLYRAKTVQNDLLKNIRRYGLTSPTRTICLWKCNTFYGSAIYCFFWKWVFTLFYFLEMGIHFIIFLIDRSYIWPINMKKSTISHIIKEMQINILMTCLLLPIQKGIHQFEDTAYWQWLRKSDLALTIDEIVNL